MKKFAANLVFTLTGNPLKNGVVTVNDEGFIVDVTDTGGNLAEQEKLEFHNGIIVPGFVNAHCHLELSHLKGATTEKQGIGNFIGEINRFRNVPTESMLDAAKRADSEMFLQGISAVGDISNTPLTLDIKSSSKIQYFTFVETFGFSPERAERAMDMALFTWQQFHNSKLDAAITPHSPYAVSSLLFRKIKNWADTQNSPLSIHNQESEAENRFFQTGDGPVLDHLQQNLGLDTTHWKPPGQSSTQWALEQLPFNNCLLLIHNTFMLLSDIQYLKEHRKTENTWLVLCPNSNLNIENKLPPVNLFRNENMQICLGTDSLASNRWLSVLSEMIVLQENFPALEMSELLTWACKNGATALGYDNRLGTIEVGKKPGLVVISGVDLENLKLTTQSRAKRLV